MPTPDLVPKYEYKTVKVPPYVINRWNSRYPGHDLYYTQRINPITKRSHWQPYCKCKGWRSTQWFPSRGRRTELHYVECHIDEVAKQGQLSLTTPDQDKAAQVRYSGDDWNSISHLHEPTLLAPYPRGDDSPSTV